MKKDIFFGSTKHIARFDGSIIRYLVTRANLICKAGHSVTELRVICEARAGQWQKHVVSTRFVGTNNERPKLQSGSKFRFAAPQSADR